MQKIIPSYIEGFCLHQNFLVQDIECLDPIESRYFHCIFGYIPLPCLLLASVKETVEEYGQLENKNGNGNKNGKGHLKRKSKCWNGLLTTAQLYSVE